MNPRTLVLLAIAVASCFATCFGNAATTFNNRKLLTPSIADLVASDFHPAKDVSGQVSDGGPLNQPLNSVTRTLLAKKPPSPPPPPPPAPPGSGSSSSSTTTIIIAVAAGVGGFLLIVVGIVCWCGCRRSKKTAAAEKNMASRPQISDGSTEFYDEPSKGFESSMMSMPPPQQTYMATAVPAAGVASMNYNQANAYPPAAGGPLGAGATVIAGDVPPAYGNYPAASSTSTAQSSANKKAIKSATLNRDGITAMEMEMQAERSAASGYRDQFLNWVGSQIEGERVKSMAAVGGAAALASAKSKSSRSTSTADISAHTIPFSDLKIGKKIGEGSFGNVYLATWHETPVAAKILVDETTALDRKNEAALRKISDTVMAKLGEEASLMSSLRHPNILQYMGMCDMPPAIITEYCNRGSLTDVLKAGLKDPEKAAELTWERRLSMALDAATGMLHLHARNPPILHRDLKSPNLLVDTHWKVKVADFNLSKLMQDSTQSSSLAAMNPRWLAPEVMSGESASAASDVYSFGIVLWELLVWQLPWSGNNAWAIVHVVGNGGRLEIPDLDDLPGDGDQFSKLPAYIALMQRCWAQNPYDRPNFSEVIAELRTLLAAAPRPAATKPAVAAKTTGPTTLTADALARHMSMDSTTSPPGSGNYGELGSLTTQYVSQPGGTGRGNYDDALNSMNTQYNSKYASNPGSKKGLRNSWTSR